MTYLVAFDLAQHILLSPDELVSDAIRVVAPIVNNLPLATVGELRKSGNQDTYRYCSSNNCDEEWLAFDYHRIMKTLFVDARL